MFVLAQSWICIHLPQCSQPCLKCSTSWVSDMAEDAAWIWQSVGSKSLMHRGSRLALKKLLDGKEGEVGGEPEEWLRYRYHMHYAEGTMMTYLIALIIVRGIVSFPLTWSALLGRQPHFSKVSLFSFSSPLPMPSQPQLNPNSWIRISSLICIFSKAKLPLRQTMISICADPSSQELSLGMLRGLNYPSHANGRCRRSSTSMGSLAMTCNFKVHTAVFLRIQSVVGMVGLMDCLCCYLVIWSILDDTMVVLAVVVIFYAFQIDRWNNDSLQIKMYLLRFLSWHWVKVVSCGSWSI